MVGFNLKSITGRVNKVREHPQIIIPIIILIFFLVNFGSDTLTFIKETIYEYTEIDIDEIEIIRTTETTLKTTTTTIKKTTTSTTTTTTSTTTTTTGTTTTLILPIDALLYFTRETDTRLEDGKESDTLLVDGRYIMFYSRENEIRIALSDRGLSYADNGTVLSGGVQGQRAIANPCVYRLLNGSYRMIYEGVDQGGMEWIESMWKRLPAEQRFYSAISDDLFNWVKEPDVRFQDYEDSDDPYKLYVADPEVIRLPNNTLRMYYSTGRWLRTALSFDDGSNWHRESRIVFGNTILSDPKSFILPERVYKLYFTSKNMDNDTASVILSASSRDGKSFKLDQGIRIVPERDSDIASDPDIVRMKDGRYRMYYSQARRNYSRYKIKSVVGFL